MSRISLILLASLMASGCGSEADPGPLGTPKATAADPGASAAEAEDRAVSHVIQGYNELTSAARSNIVDNYFRAVGEELPPADRLVNVNLTTILPFDRSLDGARKSFAEAKAARADLPLVTDAEALANAALALADAYRSAARYYAAQTFKDDDGAQVAPLHAAFMQALESYAGAQQKVAHGLELRERAALAADLARFEPTTISYWYRKTLIDAKELLGAQRDPGDGTAFAAANDAFQKTAEKLSAFAKSKPDAPQQFKAFDTFVSESMATRAASLSRKLLDPATKPYELESDGTTLVQYYNNLVQMANSLGKMEARGDLQE